MSRIGLKPIPVPAGVEIRIEENLSIVKGPKGELQQHIPSGIAIDVTDGVVRCTRDDNAPKVRASHGLVRALIANQFEGVTKGFSKTLDIVGVGYKAEMKGKTLVLHLGYSHQIDYTICEGVEVNLPSQIQIVVSGTSKQAVGQTAAEIREFRSPEPYKGKGIKYSDEIIRKKAGKSAAKG